MKKLLTLLAILVTFNAYSQNTTTLPTGTNTSTISARTTGTDSLHTTWFSFPGIGWNRMVTMTEGNLRYVPTTRQLLNGYGIMGGGSLATDRTTAVDTTVIVRKPNLASQMALKASIAYVDGLVVGLLNDRGSYDASSNVYPSTGGSGTSGAILKGNLWAISVAGTLGGVSVGIGDWLRALTDAPAQIAANWSVVKGNFGYVPENVANKTNTISSSTTQYPSVKAIQDYAFPLPVYTSLSTGDLLRYNGSTWINSRILATGPLNWNTSTYTMSMGQATTSADGYLSSADWNTFNGKLSLTGGNMTGDINYNIGTVTGSLNPLAGIGILWRKNSDYGKIYYESSGDATGDSNLILETGDTRTIAGGPTEGIKFRNYDGTLNNTVDYFTANITGVSVYGNLSATQNIIAGSATSTYSTSSRGMFLAQGTASALYGFNVNGVNQAYILHDGSQWKFNGENSSPIRFAVSGTNILEVNSGGILVSGIATTTQYKLSALNSPVLTSTATGTYGEIRWTGDYMYLCVATNQWVRVALLTW